MPAILLNALLMSLMFGSALVIFATRSGPAMGVAIIVFLAAWCSFNLVQARRD